MLAALVIAYAINSNLLRAAESDETIVPDGISNTVSDVDMRVRLAAKPNLAPCTAEGCAENQAFDARVQQMSTQLVAAAYVLYPTLQKRVPQFNFSVIDKIEPGTASNGAGRVVLFRGLQQLQLDDNALGFVMAREMGHVIGKHHSKNISTKLIISALASIAFPALAVISASSAAAQASTATTLLTSAASTATSMVGGEVALAKMKPNQLMEADEIALKLLSEQEWDMRTATNVLQLDDYTQNSWTKDLQLSNNTLQKLVEQEDTAVVELEDDFIADADEDIASDTIEIHALQADIENEDSSAIDIPADTIEDGSGNIAAQTPQPEL